MVFLILWLVASAVALPVSALAVEDNAGTASEKASDAANARELRPGNKIKLTVFGEEDLSGTFEVDATGALSLPLIGNVHAAGLEPSEIEQLVTDKFKEGYLVNPRVSIEVLNYEPVFILGEVNKPGSYPYVDGLTVIDAVALGGGFTPRARKSSMEIIRQKNGKKTEMEAVNSTLVYPGDTVQIEERLF
ncbi:MAG: polysaccharide export protein [Pseudomonadota bacterium]|nr:polysaccharide export protein [Pseudomonadota bacterium]